MLTRLQVTNFKNLVDVDVRFGTFTCIAGTNGVGKSNLFDAIRFLSMLADLPLSEAVASMRDEGSKTADLQTLFHRTGDNYADLMQFSAEMIIPESGIDDLGQAAKATINFLKYDLEIRYRKPDNYNPLGSLEITKEELKPLKATSAFKNLAFPHSKAFRVSAIRGRRNGGAPFISTLEQDHKSIIQLHQDGGRGQAQKRVAAQLPRTVISVTNATEHPTLLLVRREMQSWQMLQMEPSALRRPDELSSQSKMAANGAHMPATLYRLAYEELKNKHKDQFAFPSEDVFSAKIFSRVARRLNELIEDVKDIIVSKDDVRNNIVLKARLRDGTELPARSLSDGTLRFLALSILQLDSQSTGLLCMEEPENGIHPARIRAMLDLLKDIACDPHNPVGVDNPLRQVIINTHSPAVVQEVPEDSLIIADTVMVNRVINDKNTSFLKLNLNCLKGTWRSDAGMPEMSMGTLLNYLNPVVNSPANEHEEDVELVMFSNTKLKRVIDRTDIQQLKLDFAK
jgi:predicted ATPase